MIKISLSVVWCFFDLNIQIFDSFMQKHGKRRKSSFVIISCIIYMKLQLNIDCICMYGIIQLNLIA